MKVFSRKLGLEYIVGTKFLLHNLNKNIKPYILDPGSVHIYSSFFNLYSDAQISLKFKLQDNKHMFFMTD